MKRTTPKTRTAKTVATGASVGPVRSSWTALLAATALGVAGASMVHADIKSTATLDSSRSYRLIVQSYEHAEGTTVGDRERPLASVQRAVTAEELKNGVRVGLLEFRQDRRASDDGAEVKASRPVVLAWIEEGRADLEFDGLRARPQPGSVVGAAPRSAETKAVSISMGVPA